MRGGSVECRSSAPIVPLNIFMSIDGSQRNFGAMDVAEIKQRQDVSATEAFVSC